MLHSFAKKIVFSWETLCLVTELLFPRETHKAWAIPLRNLAFARKTFAFSQEKQISVKKPFRFHKKNCVYSQNLCFFQETKDFAVLRETSRSIAAFCFSRHFVHTFKTFVIFQRVLKKLSIHWQIFWVPMKNKDLSVLSEHNVYLEELKFCMRTWKHWNNFPSISYFSL